MDGWIRPRYYGNDSDHEQPPIGRPIGYPNPIICSGHRIRWVAVVAIVVINRLKEDIYLNFYLKNNCIMIIKFLIWY